MRLAIISDIHGNIEAFRAVIADIDQNRVDGLACLGDNIGYGPESEEVVRLICERDIPCVMGNHELAIVDRTYLDWMNPAAQRSLLITHEHLSQDTLSYICNLRPSMIFHGSLCVHGCPPDSMTCYLIEVSTGRLKELFLSMEEKICFVGHTHFLELISFDGEEVTRAPLCEGLSFMEKDQRYIVNVGSVGQPRDGNNTAKYVVWDDSSETIEVRFIPYDIACTARKILELGYPESNARRLW